MNVVAVAAILSMMATTVADGQSIRPDSAATRAERSRFAAMISHDVAALDTLLADDVVYVHTSGLMQTKQQLLRSIRSGEFTYIAIAPTIHRAQVLSDSAVVVTGSSHMTLGGDAGPREFDIRFSDVLVRRVNRWVCVAWQSTRLQ